MRVLLAPDSFGGSLTAAVDDDVPELLTGARYAVSEGVVERV